MRPTKILRPQRLIPALLAAITAAATPAAAQVTYNAIYDPTTGTLPSVACPAWNVVDTAAPENPTVAGGVLTIDTSVNTENIYFRQASPFLSIPSTLVVEFRVKLISGSGTTIKGPIAVSITTATSTGTLFFIGAGEMWLNASSVARGQTASVATTDDFHTYRIEIASVSDIKVYYDGVLKLTGAEYVSGSDFGAPAIFWGEASSNALGHSEWQYFKHNAAGQACSASTFASTWAASNALYPDQICPPYSLIDTEPTFDPTLSGGKLNLATTDTTNTMAYVQSVVAFPDPFIIEMNAKLNSGASNSSARGPISVNITTEPTIGIAFFVENGAMFVSQGHGGGGELIRGPSASVPTTDALHTYRLEIAATGAVSAFYDGVFKFTTNTYNDVGDHGNQRRVLWGEGSRAALGNEDWTFVRHNAYVSTIPSAFSLATPGEGDSIPTWRVPLDWTDAGCASPISYYLQVDTLNTFATAAQYGPQAVSQQTLYLNFVQGKRYFWRVKAKNSAGDSTWATPSYRSFVLFSPSYPTGIETDFGSEHFSIRALGPNPFSGATGAEYFLPEGAHVRASVVGVTGRAVRTIDLGEVPSGQHRVEWDGRTSGGARAAAGVYFIRLEAGKRRATVKCLLLK